MRINEIMEATPGNGPASATQVKPPAPARLATPALKPTTPAAKPATPPAAKSINSAAGKKAADMLDLDKNNIAPLKVDPKQINKMMQLGPAT